MNTIGPTPDPISIFTITSIIRYNALELKRYPRNNFESTPLKLSMNIWLTRKKTYREIKSLKIYELEEIHHKTQTTNRGTASATFSPGIWPRRIAIFLPFRPADCSMERQCARPVRRWSICLNGQRHRPAAHNGRVGCQGHKSISRKRSKVARCIEARETAARRGFRSSRALSSTSPTPSTIL